MQFPEACKFATAEQPLHRSENRCSPPAGKIRLQLHTVSPDFNVSMYVSVILLQFIAGTNFDQHTNRRRVCLIIIPVGTAVMQHMGDK